MRVHTILFAVLPALALAQEADGNTPHGEDFEGGTVSVPGPSISSTSSTPPIPTATTAEGSDDELTSVIAHETHTAATAAVTSPVITGGLNETAENGTEGANGTEGIAANESHLPNSPTNSTSESGALMTGTAGPGALGLVVAGLGVAALL